MQDVFDTFFGDSNFDYLSIQYRPGQYSSSTTYADVISHLRNDTSTAGRPLALMFDELERATTADDESHVSSGASCESGAKYLRKATLWQCYLGGAGGVEWILSDLLNAHDFRRYEALWGYTRHARSFMEQLPITDMVPSHNLLTDESTYTVPLYDIEGVVLAKAGEVYAIQLPNATQTGTLDLSGASWPFSKRWYNPRTGSFEGPTTTIAGGGSVALGSPPSSSSEDWVVLLQKDLDSDGDGIADAWEQTHFGNLTAADAVSDSDQDGATDLHEFRTHMDPTNSVSFLGFSRVLTDPAEGTINVEWTGSSLATYRVETNTELSGTWGVRTNGISGMPLNVLSVPTSKDRLFLRVIQE